MLSNILVVDDENQIKQTFLDIFREEIEKGYYNFDFATDGKEALQKISSGSMATIDLLLTDVKMPEIDGLSLINLLQKANFNIKTIIISAYVSPQDIKEAIENNDSILGFLSKPIDNIDRLKNIVKKNLHLAEKSTLTSLFNYQSLEARDYDFIQQKTREIKSSIEKSTQTIVEIGCKLIEVKSRLKHGQFGDWLKLEFDWSEPTAQRFMRVARKFKSVNLTDLSIAPSALYLLAAASIPELARTEAINRAVNGESIDYKKAKLIKDKYTQIDSQQKTIDTQAKRENDRKDIRITKTSILPQQSKNRETNFILPNQLRVNPQINAQDNSKSTLPSSSRQIDAIESESWWRIGNEHLLFCGDPQSETFKQSIPQKIELNIAFPDTPNWRLNIPGKVNSELVFFSQYQDLDLTLLRQAVEQLFLLYTEDSSIVVFSFLPDPQLIMLAERLNCICRIAEPNLSRCQKIISTVRQAGWNAVSLTASLN
jgi:CheY-like chemotaxis protein